MTTAAEGFKNNLDAQIKSITNRYQPAISELQARGRKLATDYNKPDGAEIAIRMDFDVTWKDEEIIFDLPSVIMRTTAISMDIPEVTMETQTIIFHTPSMRMMTKKVRQYPEFHGFTVRWKDILIDVPETFMEEQKIIFDLPSVTMRTQEWKLDLPEFAMEQQRWVIGLPQFTLKNVTVETEKIKNSGEKLREEGRQLGERMKAEIQAVIAGGTAASGQDAISVKNQIATQFEAAIAALTKAINELVAKGIDPIKVPSATGDVNLRKQLADLIAKRDAAMMAADNPISAATDPTRPASAITPAPAEAAEGAPAA